MKVRIAIVFLSLITVLGAGLAETESKPSEPFHVAQTPAEKTLDDILRRAGEDSNMFFYVLGRPWYDAKKDTGYSSLFTKDFLQAVAKVESDFLKQTCGGKFTGDDCGLHYNPILCAQDISESGYLHRTMEDDGRKAIISAFGVDLDPQAVKTSYRFIKGGDDWKLDGVACGWGGEFNMDCGSSVCPKASDLRKKAKWGDADAQYSLGVMYNIGRGVKREFAKALSLFRKAAKQGHADAQYYLGSIYLYSLDMKRDYGEAAKWFRKAAKQGHADAQYYLGDLYEYGWGVKRDYAEAAKWFRKAAEQGQVQSQYNLGYQYEYGLGVEQDHAEAVEWYRKAAEQGYASAQYHLGMMYQAGRGVTKDDAKAAEWLREAAKRGHRKARQEVEKLDQR